MNNIINYYYGINVFDIYKYMDKYVFNYNGIKYYFVKYDRARNDIKGILDVCVELKKRNILTNDLVCNKFNNYITPYKNELYVLIRQNIKKSNININDIFYIQNNTLNMLVDKSIIRTNCIKLWEEKLDFYEKKSLELSGRYSLIKRTIDYYIGLGENAIVYLINNNVRISKMVLSHRRLDNMNDSFDFYNPLNYIFDVKSRDIADYIKILFFYDQASEDLIISFFKYLNFSREEYILLIARLLYPTYYFDLIDKVIFFNEDDEILKNIINKSQSYIKMIKKLFYYINNELKMNIPIIEWIIKI